MMIEAQLSSRLAIAGGGSLIDQPNPIGWVSSSLSYSSTRCTFKSGRRKCCKSKLTVINISCKSSRGSFSHKSNNSGARDDDDDDYVEAVVLLSDTIKHYRMLMHGFQGGTKWQSSGQLGPFSMQAKDRRADGDSIGPGFLQRFQNPTIFLKVSCDGDFVLPIIVGEFAVEKLFETLHEDETGDCPNHFQMVRDLFDRLGYAVKMVRITERVVNTYFARIYFHKPGEKNILSVDSRPSDAINIARRCMAPIYINKRIILTDAIRIVRGMGKTSNVKSTYDAILDSPKDGPDLLAEELNIVTNMNLAAKEERYSDAAMWRDRLMKLRENR